ncbi:MAG: lipopolysaccharide biosynthesis protein [Solirubrobacterales bacterium]|nr:lipopolysaccharide biosynthesis protein [Solirubrobacterales bacterium]
MGSFLKRLLSSLGAYQLANFVGKIFALVLVPVYTGKIAPAGYGITETLMTFVVLISIVVRLGIIEAFLRFYYADTDPARRDALVRRAVYFLAATTTVACIALAIPAAELARLVTSQPAVWPFRTAILGVWAFTNLELGNAILRVDERIRAYAIVAMTNVLGTVALSLALVVVANRGYEGLLLGNYAISVVVLLGLWWSMRKRLAPRRRPPGLESFRALFRFGLPTVPAEASVYALSVLDRQYIVHQQGVAAAGRYAIAIKVAAAIAFLVTAFQYAWPPLAYSVTDDNEAAFLYGRITTYYLLVTGWAVAGVTLEARNIIAFLAPHPGYLQAYTAAPWLSLGWALYGLWVVLLVIAGRAHVTRRNFTAALAGLAVNVVLLVVLVPRWGIAGGGIALAGAYVAMLGVMHLLIRRAFAASFEWGRLAHLLVVIGGLSVAGALLLPQVGAVGLLTRAAVFLAIPVVLFVTGFLHASELDGARRLVARLT